LNETSRRVVVFVVIVIALVGLATILMTLGNDNRTPENDVPDDVPDINAPGTGTLAISVTNLNSFDRNVSINWHAKQWTSHFIAAGDTWSGSYQVNWTGPAPVVGVSVISEGWSDRQVVQMIENSIVSVNFELS